MTTLAELVSHEVAEYDKWQTELMASLVNIELAEAGMGDIGEWFCLRCDDSYYGTEGLCYHCMKWLTDNFTNIPAY